MTARSVRVIDSHTEGEPTRLVVSGGPDLGAPPLAEQRDRLRRDHDELRRGLVSEPRGNPIAVGAFLTAPTAPEETAGLIFFDDGGYLGMCGHGTIGAVVSLAHLGRLRPGHHSFGTPVGRVETELHPDGSVTLVNVASRRSRAAVRVAVPEFAPVVGDVVWGGNWFFVTEEAPWPLRPAHLEDLLAYTRAIHRALAAAGVVGEDGGPIDHVELLGPPEDPRNDARNFVLCPSGVHDRSPCGTGTSAQVARLWADGRLRAGQEWRQEGFLGGVFRAGLRVEGDAIRPWVRGTAHVVAEADVMIDDRDPFLARPGGP